MRIVIIGAGNVATILGKLISSANHAVLQVVSRNITHAKELAGILNCDFTDNFNLIDTSADIYLIAVSDDALIEMAKKINLNNKIIVHTAGSVSIDILQNTSSNYGVMYPLQSLRKEMPELPEIPLLIDANSAETLEFIESFAHSISDKVVRSNDDQRLHLHIAAVVVSNFTNHLYALAEKFCGDEKIDFKMLLPLIKETAGRIELHSAKEMQTGPALRNDFVTLDKHYKVLVKYPKLRNLYLKITDSILAD